MKKEDLINTLLDCVNYVNLQDADPLEAIEYITHTLYRYGYEETDIQSVIELARVCYEEEVMQTYEL